MVRRSKPLFMQFAVVMGLSSALIAMLITLVIANQSVLRIEDAYAHAFVVEAEHHLDRLTPGQALDLTTRIQLGYLYRRIAVYRLDGTFVQAFLETSSDQGFPSQKGNLPASQLDAFDTEGGNTFFLLNSGDSWLNQEIRVFIRDQNHIFVFDGPLPHYPKAAIRLVQNSIMLVFIGAVFSIFIASKTSERITTPLEQMTQDIVAMQEDSTRTFSERGSHECEEVSILANAFDALRLKNIAAFEDIQKINENLERRVEERTADLKSTNQELETTLENLQKAQDFIIESQKQAAITTLVRGIAHNVNTPLGNAITSLSYLRAVLLEDGVPDVRQMGLSLDIIERNLYRTADIVRTLKRVSYQESVEEKTPTDLCRYLNELVQLIGMAPENQSMKLLLECDLFNVVLIKPLLLMQVLTALIENARLHAFEDDGDKLVRIAVIRVQDTVVIRVSDNGIGIPQDERETLFKPFENLSGNSAHLGVGLHIARNQMFSIGGTLTLIDSEIGATFELSFPMEEVAT